MKFSLLQKHPDPFCACECLYDLSLDRAVAEILPDRRRADAFLQVLGRPLTSPDNIVFRQQIYTDLRTVPGLLDALKTLFSRYDKIKSDWQEMKLGTVNGRGSEINPEALLEHTFASLKVTAIFPSTIVSFFTTIGQTLSAYPLRSEGLTAMRDWCSAMAENEALKELLDISQKFRYQTPEAFDFTVLVSLDRTLRLHSADLYDIVGHKEEAAGLGKLFGRKKADEGKVAVTAELSEAGEDPHTDATYLLSEALSRIDAALTQVTSHVYDAFFGLSQELLFYEGALLYAAKAEAVGVPLVLPTVTDAEEDVFEAEGMRELLLLSQGKATVPNDLFLDRGHHGLLVKGLTDSGKTVFLRAVGALQLFAQAGLPVLAERARVSVRRGFFSHFSSAEEEFLVGDASGRFDQEAGEISGIMDRLVPYSLLLLNETFQTTSYREGTESIYDILRFLPKLKTKYIFVTHLTRLFGYMEKEPVLLAHTSEDAERKYKILQEE